MDEDRRSLLIRSSSHYSSSPGLELRYGAHGFVGDASVLRSAAYRIGILAALRSAQSKSVTGVMITACGGSVERNGLRIVDPDGGALIADWETLADSVVNVVDPEEFVTLIEECVKKENISFDGGQSAEVLLGRDTSPSGESLLEAAKQGISSVSGTIFNDMGILTTPQLHWLVRARNKGMKASEHDYFKQLSSSYRCLVDFIPEGATSDNISETVVVDGANGVGGDKIEALKDLCDGLAIEIRNTSKSSAILNQGVGVDFIREQMVAPSGFGSNDIGFRCASLDGDADRLLYFAVLPSHKEIEIVDGDRILFLFTLFINEQLHFLEEVENESEEGHYHACLGILRSACENGVTNYLRSLGLDVVSLPPGTRILHAEASKYDIGIYYEADGHGGILFSDNYLSWLEAKNNVLLTSSKGSRRQLSVSRLLAVSRLMNSTVFDALSGLLLVEAILQHNGWSLQKWNEIYCDLINRQLNVVELEEKIAVATEDPKLIADSLSGTKEEADTVIDDEISENEKDGSHLSEESKHIDTGTTGSAVQQVVDYEAHSLEQTGVDASVELEESQEQGTTTYAQAHENETHTGLPEEFQESHQSQVISLHSDETADENKLEARASQDGCVIAERVMILESKTGISGDSLTAEVLKEAEDPDHVIDKEKIEIKRGESDDDAWVLVNDGKGCNLNAGPVMTEIRDYEHLPELDDPSNEKESCSSPKVNGILSPIENVDDLLVSADTDRAEEAGVISGTESVCDAQPQLSNDIEGCSSPKVNGILALVENEDALLVSADTDKAKEVRAISGTESAASDAQPRPQTNSGDKDKLQLPNEKESCSSPKANGILAPVENVDDLLVSSITDEAEEAQTEATSGTESCCDAQPQPQKSSGDTDPPSEKESCSSPKANGILAPVENVDDLLVLSVTDEAEEAQAEATSGTESCCDAQPQPQTSSGDIDKPQPFNEEENCSSPKVNGILAPVENVDDLLASAYTDKAEEAGVVNATETACDAQPQPQTSSGDSDKSQPCIEKENCSSPKVNGTLAPTENVDGLLVSSDTVKFEEAGVISGTASSSDAQSQPQMNSGDRFPSVIIHDEKLEANALNGSVDVDNGSNCLVNGTSLNAVRVSSCSDGDDICVPINSGEAATSLSDDGEEIGDLTVVGYASHTVAPQVNGVAVKLPPFDHAAKVEAKAENSQVDVDNGSNYLFDGENSDMRIRFSSSEVNVESPAETLKNLTIPSDVDDTEEAGATNDVAAIKSPSDVHANKLDSDAENGGVGVANGIDVCPDDVAERSVTDSAGTAKHDSEVNGGVSGFATVQMAEPEVKSGNDPAEVENGSESTTGNLEGVSSPCVCNTSEIEVTETATVSDGSAGTATHDSEVNGIQMDEPRIKSEKDPEEVESKSESTVDNVGVSSPCVNRSVETEVTDEFESVPDFQPPSEISGSSIAHYASAQHGELETQAEALDAQEIETITVSDGTVPPFQVINHDAQETDLESKAENTPVNGDKRKDCLVRGVSVNTNIRFGTLEFVGNMCPKPEAPSTGSRHVDRDDSASSNLAEGNIRVEETFNEINSQQHVADNHCEHKVEDILGSSDFPHDDPAMPTVPTVGTSSVDEESTSSLEGSATAGFDGESVGDEPVKKPFYYLIKTPKYDDEKLTEQIRSAEIQLEEKTRSRDAVLAEYRQKKETCQKLRANQQAAILEERAARDLVRAKRKEIESAQSLVNIAKDATTIEDLDNKIANMEHTIQHETVPLNEEKKLIREIKQSKHMREQLLTTTNMQGAQQALDQKDKNEDRVKVLRKEMDALRRKLSEAEQAVKAAMKRLDSEHAMLNELHRQLTSSNDVRQEAYSNLQKLRSQWSDKNKQFWSFKNVQRQANSYAASSDRASLQSLCVNQVESIMKSWNSDKDYRRDYKRCNLRSTLRRLGTSDGRSLGPDEEPPLLAMGHVRRINAPVKDRQESRVAAVQPEPVVESRRADIKSANKVVEQLKPNAIAKKPSKASPLKIEESQASPLKIEEAQASPLKIEEAQASNTVKIEEDKEDLEILKAKKEEEELARKEEELKKEKEAARLKEARRLEEKAKFQEALERKRKKAEKAQAKAELKARKEAEEKEKEKEKRAKKKETKKGWTAEDATSNPDSEVATNPDGPSEPTKELETREKSVTIIKRAQKLQYTKQNKLKTILPPPPPLRNRGKRKMGPWMWMALTVMAILGLFFLGNLNPREITGIFSFWH